MACLANLKSARPLRHGLSDRLQLLEVNMDFFYIGLTLGFFALSVALVHVLGMLRGPK